MKREIISIALSLLSVCGMAQQKTDNQESGILRHKTYETNRFFDNWFVNIAGGINVYEGESDHKATLGNRLSPALDISVGKWITPAYGVRLQYSGLQAKGLTATQSGYAKKQYRNYYKEKFGILNIHTDLMWNWSNAFAGYKDERIWNFIPFVGFGWARSYGSNQHNDEIAATLGILNTFRLNKRIDLTLETRQMFVNQSFDGVVGGCKGEGMSSVTLGLNFKLGKTTFTPVSKVATADYSRYNNYINELRIQNEELDSKVQHLITELENARKADLEVVVELKPVASPVALFFEIGKTVLDSKELVNLEFYVKNAMKTDPNKTFILIGSADKDTGSKELNQRLSEKRIDYVYNLLINKYGISANRLIKKAEGDTNNRFGEPKLNRAVIVE